MMLGIPPQEMPLQIPHFRTYALRPMGGEFGGVHDAIHAGAPGRAALSFLAAGRKVRATTLVLVIPEQSAREIFGPKVPRGPFPKVRTERSQIGNGAEQSDGAVLGETDPGEVSFRE